MRSWSVLCYLSFHILRNPKVYYRVYKSPPPFPVLIHINPFHAQHPISWRSILILSSHLRLCLPSGLSPSGFLTKSLYSPLLLPIRATCPTHLILHDLMIRTVLGEEYRSLSSSSSSFSHSHVTSFLLGPNIFLSTVFSNTLSLRSSQTWATQFHTHKKQQAKLYFILSKELYQSLYCDFVLHSGLETYT